MKRTIARLSIGLVLPLGLLLGPRHVRAQSPQPAVPAWAAADAASLVGVTGPTADDPGQKSVTVAQLAAEIYQNAVLSQNSRVKSYKHGSIDPQTGNALNDAGQAVVDHTGHRLVPSSSGATSTTVTPLTGCITNDPNPLCHSYGGTRASVSPVDENGCYTNPVGYDGCMSEPNSGGYIYFCGPGSSRVMASNWYGTALYNLGASPISSTSKGYAYYEHTDPNGGGTLASNMAPAIQNDISNHLGSAPSITSSGSGSQNTFQDRTGHDANAQDVFITGLLTRNPIPLPEWANWPNNVTHFVSIVAYDFTTNPGSITWYDTAAPYSGSTGATKASMGVYDFWANVAGYDHQVWIPV